MTKSTVQKSMVIISMAGLMLAFSMTSAFAWDMAAHAYIEEHLNKQSGQADNAVLYNRIYGSGAMDLFNNVFSSPYSDFAAYLHDPGQNNYLKVWDIAKNRDEKAFAYGFVGHNNRWGMDSTAHVSGLTFGRSEGYVIAKARILATMLGPALEDQFGYPLQESVVIDLCHYLIESGVDFLVRAKDPEIGNKLMAAAANRSSKVPLLLAEAYKKDFAELSGSETAAELDIKIAEKNFQATMMEYGYALAQEDAKALELVAAGMASVGVDYLDLSSEAEEDLAAFARQGILAAMDLCAPDFERELKATTGWLNGRLSSNGIVW